MKRLDYLLLILFILIGIYFGIFIYLLGFKGQNIDIASDIVPKLYSCPVRSGKCYKTLAVNLLDKYKLAEVLNILEKQQRQEGRLDFVTCHNITHYLGREAYIRSNNIQETFKQCSNICQTGCFHGVIEEHLVKNNVSMEDDIAISRSVQSLCGKVSDYERLLEFQE